MPDLVVVTESGIVTVSQGETLVTVYDGRGLKGDPGDTFNQTLNTTDAVEFSGLINNGLTFPTSDGTAGQVIETDGAGVLSFVTPSGGDYLPLAGGTMTGNIVFDGTSGQFIGKGTFDTSRGGNYGLSIVCSVGYEFNWQAGWLITTEQSSATPRPLYLDSLAGTTLRAWDSSKSTGTEIDHLGITFPDATIQTTAYTGSGGVSSLTAGAGISLDVTTGDITVTNSEPDQTVTLTDGTGITITGTYPSFTIDCDITQYTDTDARLSLSAGTGISYDDATGIITNDYPDQTVTLTDGTGISITGTYPSFTIDCDITQYTDTDARLALSAGTGISYDDATGIITNDEPDQTVTLTGGTDISVTGTYPDFTIDFDGNTSYLPLSGGTVAGSITSFGTTHDTEVSGDFFGVQLSADHTQGTMVNFDGLDTYDGASHMKVTPTGLTFPDKTTQTTAYTGGAGVSSITAGTGISLDVTAGDVTVTNDAPDQTVSLTDGTGISVTGTYPDFTIDCDITQYTDTDARLALSAGTGISYDDATGIITNDEPDQTVTLTNGTDISITGTYPSFTIAYSGTPSSGTVTKTSVVSANGFAGTVATDTTTPAITISTSITGLLKGNGTAISAATSGTDYVVPSGSITGNAATVTTNADLTGVITSKGNATSIASQTGTGSKFVVDTSPTLVTPDIGAATGTSLTLSGDLTVNGTTTTISSTTLAVGDKNIVLASASTTDAGADGGGLTLKGATDHTWNWVDATDAWTSSDHINIASGKSYYINGTVVLSATALGSGISVTATTNANLTGVITSVGNATSIASQTGTGTKFVMDTSPTLITPVLGTPTSGTLTNCTFPTLNQSTTGNAATVTTNANLTGVITSVGNATSIASQTGTGSKFVVDTSPTLVTPTIGAATATTVNKITITAPATGATLTIVEGATLTASATASVSGTNTGDNATNTLYSGLVSNATHTGDATGSTALTVVKINGVLMSGLATGILKNTTTTGVPSIATAGTDYVIPSGNITGTAAGLSATLAVTSGGTGQITATAAFNGLAPSQASNSGKYLKTDGTNTSWGTLPSSLPVLLFGGVTTTSVSVANGSLPVLLFGGVTTVNVTVT